MPDVECVITVQVTGMKSLELKGAVPGPVEAARLITATLAQLLKDIATGDMPLQPDKDPKIQVARDLPKGLPPPNHRGQ